MKNPRLTNVVAILTAARFQILNGGFCKGQMSHERKNGTAYCTLGAIQSVARNAKVEHQARDAFLAYGVPSKFQRGPFWGIVTFNDAVKTRKRDVVRAFNRAIKALTA